MFVQLFLIYMPSIHVYSSVLVLYYRELKHLTILEHLTIILWNGTYMIDTLSAEPLKHASVTTQNTVDYLIQWFGEFVRLKAHYHQPSPGYNFFSSNK